MAKQKMPIWISSCRKSAVRQKKEDRLFWFVIFFLFTGVLSVFQVKNLAADAAKQQESYTEVVSAVPGIDYEALYRSHPAEEVVATVNGEPVLWDEYFYFYCGYVAEVESIMDYYSQHGVPISWEDTYQDGLTWADVPAESAEQSILEYRGIHLFAEENGISLPADAEEQINRQIRESAESLLGEEATEEAFAAYLAKGYLSMPVYRRMLSTNLLYQQVLTELYGDSSEESDVQNAQAEKIFPLFQKKLFSVRMWQVIKSSDKHPYMLC